MASWFEVRVIINREAQEAAVERLLNLGAGGVSIEDPLLITEAIANDWGDYFPPNPTGDVNTIVVVAYFSQRVDGEEIENELAALSRFNLETGEVKVNVKEVNEEDWADGWKQYYHGERVGRVVISPSWDSYTPQSGEILVELDPGMAFGTGNHPTTMMCLELLQQLPIRDKLIWDVGTGSGILAISAHKLGAKKVVAVDIDPVAVQVAKDNASLNRTEITISEGSLDTLRGQADLIVANIIADVIIPMLPKISDHLLPDGYFIASGIIENRAHDVSTEARKQGLELVTELAEGEWVAYVFQDKERKNG